MSEPVRNRRVVITGLGMITCLGASTRDCWDALVAGRTGIRTVSRFDTRDCSVRIGGELTDAYFEMEAKAFPKRLRNQTLASTRLGILCARAAVEDAGFAPCPEDAARVGIVTGCSQPTYQEGMEGGKLDLGNYVVIRQMVNAIPAWIGIQNGFKGPSFNVATACASGSFSTAMAFDLVRSGQCDAALSVGLDLLLNYESLMGFSSLMALASRNDAPDQAMCPFDRRRTGFVLANGGCGLLLEEEESARRRGARIYAEMAGYGLCAEAHNIVAPEPTGKDMARAMKLALAHAGLNREDIGYISAHGTSTIQNDAAETAATKLVFGEHAGKLAISSQKSMTGHTIGGAGAIECAATALCLYHRVLTPTINHREPDPACDLDYVPNTARQAPELKAALSNSFAFGGHNASLALVRAA